MKVGVLLFNLGGPETLEDVKPFLYNLFSDPEIIQVQWTPLRKAIAWFIATTRKKKSQGYYAQIGGGSPLRRLTEEQRKALELELRARGRETEVFVGMCTWRPFLYDTVDAIADSDIDSLVILPLFPQYSVTTTGSGFGALRKLLDARPAFKRFDVHWVSTWHDHPTYIESFKTAIEKELAKFAEPSKAYILFSAHSIPESYVQKGDPYLTETKKTMELIMDALGRKNTYGLAFQSKIGPVKWLGPPTNDALLDLGKKGVDNVLVVPISFVSEHIETLYELDILYKKVAKAAGIGNFRRVPALNSDPTFIRALADIVASRLK
jgi:ferrochelatase